jgi:lysophospholipase L1-like esterase
MIVRRFVALGVALTGAVSLSACSTLSQTSLPNPNVSNSRVFNYTAIAASDGVGVGASSPCTTGPVSVGGEVVQMPTPPNCPGGTGYVPVLAGLLRTGVNVVNLTDLGISGAVIGATERSLADTYEPLLPGATCTPSGPTECAPGDFIRDELPLIPSQQNTVTIFAGGNDTNAIFAHVAIACFGCSPQQIAAMITADVMNFGADYNTLLGSIHASFPFARIYVANLPNLGLIPRGKALGGSAQALLDAISTGIDSGVINGPIAASGIPVIDLECDAQSYDAANFSPDGFHPNDSGYALFAAKLNTAIRNYGAPPPAGSCPPYSLSKTRHPLSGDVRNVHLIRY